METILRDAIKSLEGSEFIGSTIPKTKIERMLLAKIAYFISKQNLDIIHHIELEGKIPSQKVSRIDLLIARNYDDNYGVDPLLAVEAKFYYSFNASSVSELYKCMTKKDKKNKKEINLLKTDIEKLSRLNIPERYILLFLGHYDQDKVPKFFKYGDDHNKSLFIDCNDYHINVKSYFEDLSLNLKNKNIFELNMGKYLGVTIKLFVYLAKIN